MVEEYKLKTDGLLTTLPMLGKEFSISFELFVATHAPAGQWQSILHMTTGADYGPYGCRTPALWMFGSQRLTIASAVSGNVNHHINHYNGVQEKSWVQLEINQIKLKEDEVGLYLSSKVYIS